VATRGISRTINSIGQAIVQVYRAFEKKVLATAIDVVVGILATAFCQGNIHKSSLGYPLLVFFNYSNMFIAE
jgi:hypothetical protein